MVRYLSTLNFTVQGIREIAQSATRADEFRVAVEKAGGKVQCQYWSLGEADGCFIFEVPDEQTATRVLIQLEQQGNVRTKTVRIFDADEFQAIVSG